MSRMSEVAMEVLKPKPPTHDATESDETTSISSVAVEEYVSEYSRALRHIVKKDD